MVLGTDRDLSICTSTCLLLVCAGNCCTVFQVLRRMHCHPTYHRVAKARGQARAEARVPGKGAQTHQAAIRPIVWPVVHSRPHFRRHNDEGSISLAGHILEFVFGSLERAICDATLFLKAP